MRLRVEFTTEPFDLDEPPQHALVAREVVQSAPLDSVDVGPFGNTAEGPAEEVLGTVQALLRDSLGAGATRISLQLNVLPDTGGDPAPDAAGGGS
ncbi:hypothetical protein DB35_09305 [Streptomyces abyssalis]|uniref:Thiamine-binding protein domain-containing protein n=1 Tax=Streptomyces abyssalis TaxID=933944 RepID=A0A1E7JRU3_9ACTN|nr:hypothetical protein [Streptomyces abyssalis]OEU91618.1 hypothetical protein AN215_03510 [Streptomyces abyssalis]OEU94246.1 hypothetical protein DB35_09305 [Streptomyces abyssalis]OEV06683.1 hypothetical protein AN219_33820 [Streptomyces nanshensis]